MGKRVGTLKASVDSLFPCPACGFLVFEETPGSYTCCPLCDWEDCAVQLRYPFATAGPNRPLVIEQEAALRRFPLETAEAKGFRRDPKWRPLRRDEASEFPAGPEDGRSYFDSIPDYDVGQELYYWRGKQVDDE